MIIKPNLPPKRGYVEVEVYGKRTYRNVETGILIEDEIELEQNVVDSESETIIPDTETTTEADSNIESDVNVEDNTDMEEEEV